ncbi:MULTISPECIES: hypothetical protein [Agrobacterium]|uniref:Uncharacterized protein n=2 Tax=Agrobacterium tumefaciens complex TaxID=1183400 RepID=A0AAW8LPE5_AGRTU|nr:MULTISPECIES: hypothetical protein [Agrobacterium]MBB4280527.1 hypothetical protein [Agrobacterium radiobacter]MBB4456388.1 hypothetical protein [Agrobacterium radiobacter]MBB4461000.1 hypothetical protein [Agrobacterium radiobacter]MBP2538468.1 hypothetical protein [Agrobacterium tumefaciens]MBP2565054.1 hypothetical protein [Agrobacterium tumefaciens]
MVEQQQPDFEDSENQNQKNGQQQAHFNGGGSLPVGKNPQVKPPEKPVP